jgi:uncharacterized protein
MKLQLEQNAGANIVTAYGDGYVDINRERHEHGLVLLPDRLIEPWADQGFEALAPAHMAVLAALQVDVVLIGTGTRQRFPAPMLLRPLMEAGLGFEVMDLQAACRTYNILVGEGRQPAAALLLR